MKPVLQSTKNVMKLKLKWKRKRLMIGCVSLTGSPKLMIEKKPQTKEKGMLYWYFQQNILYQDPHQVTHSQRLI